jgi:hypothetical protein
MYNILLSFIVTKVVICHGTMMITNDDEGDIFEDDEEEDEGYLFAGQGICTKYQIYFYTTTPLSNLYFYVQMSFQ